MASLSKAQHHVCVIRNVVAAFAMICAALAPAAHAQDPIGGSLDTTPFPGFAAGNGKISNLAIGTGADGAQAMALQPDGKVLIAGYCQGPSNVDACIARLNPDGTLDSTFDGPGGNGNGKFLLAIGASNDAISKVLIQPDGKILLGGYCAVSGFQDFCAARLNPDGTLDPTFVGPSGTGDGRILFPVGNSNDYVETMLLQPDGKIVLAGNCQVSTSSHMCVARLNPDGSFDATFDGPSGTGNGRFVFFVLGLSDYAYTSVIQPDGKILLAGGCWTGSATDFCVVRLNSDGSFDTSFDGPTGNGNGMVTFPLHPLDESVFAILLQPDGKIVLGGGGCGGDACLARLNPDGSFDTNFDGPAGTGDGRFSLAIGAGEDTVTAMALQPDGKIVLAGNCAATTMDFCLARLNVDGSLDTSFDGPAGNGNGRFLVAIGANDDFARAVALQPDGKIVVSGYCMNGGVADFCVARFNGGSAAAKNCSLDIDGDGILTATTDTLIATRIALGIRGAAVINGINFPVNAKRNTWPQLRDYLVSHCALSVY